MNWYKPPLNTGFICSVGSAAIWMLLAIENLDALDLAFRALSAGICLLFTIAAVLSWRKYGLWIRK